MSQSEHRLNIVVTNTGLNETIAATENFSKSTSGLITQQDALSNAFGKTQGAALKTGQEFSNTEKEIANTGKTSTTTAKQSMSLGEAFKSSALQITAFTSGIVSTIGQFINYQKATSSLERLQATLQTRWIGLEQAEKKLNARIAAGTISAEDAALASDKLAAKRVVLEKQTEILEQKEQQHTLSLINLATSVIPTVINGISSITTIYDKVRGTIDAATVSTDAAGESTEALGTAAETSTTLGLVPLIKNFAKWVTGAKGAHSITNTFTGALTSHGKALTAMGGSTNVVVKAFTTLGSKIKDFGSAINVDIGGATGIVDKLKTGFISFFTNIGSGFVDFGKAIKNAITSLGNIRVASIAAFLTNPAFLAITAITATVVALSGNMFGFRDAVNGVGKALGDMAPPLKGVLTWIGDMANSALDAVAGFLGFEKQIEATGESAEQAASRLGTLYVATQNIFNTQTTQDVDALVTSLEAMTAEINNLGTTGTKGIDTLSKQMSDFHAKIGEQSPAVEQLFRNFQKALNDAGADGVIYASEVKNIVKAYDELRDGLYTTIKVEENAVAAQTGVTTSTAEMGQTVAATTKFIDDYESSMRVAEDEFKQFAVAYVSGNDEMIAAMGLSEEEIGQYIDQVKEKFPGGAVVVEQFGEKVVVSLDLIKERFGATSKDIEKYIGDITKAISPGLTDTFAAAQVAVRDYNLEQQYLGDVSKLVAAGITQDSKYWADAIAAITDKYPELKLNVEKVRDAFVKAEEDQTKAREKETKEMDKQVEKVKTLSETRMEEIEASAQETQQAQLLSTELGIQTNVTDVTGKGLQGLIKIHDDLANATGMAADSVEVWYQQLKTSQAIEDATIDKLLELATNLGVKIPDSIKSQGIPAIKQFIEETEGIGEGAKKAAEEAKTAFDDIVSKANSALAGIISDKLGEDSDNVKKAIKGLEKTGIALDSLTAKKHIINIFLNDENIENDIKSLGETMIDEFGRLEDFTKEEGLQIGDSFVTNLVDEVKKKSPETADAVEGIWEAIKASSSPEETGDDIIGRLGDKLKDSEAIKTGGDSIVQTVDTSLAQLPPIGDTQGQAIVDAIGGKLNAGASTIANNADTGIRQPIVQNATLVPGEVGTAIDPIPGIFNQAFLDASIQAGTQLAGIVTDVHTKMSSMSTSVATYSESMKVNFVDFLTQSKTNIDAFTPKIQVLQLTFSTLSTSVATYMASMTTTIAEWIKASTTSMGAFINTIKLVQQTFSTLSTSVATYMKSMTTNVNSFATAANTAFNKVVASVKTAQSQISNMSSSVATYMKSMTSNVNSFASSFGSSMDSVASDAETAMQAVKDLQSAIDNLKDKTVTITANIEGAGKDKLQHGGSALTTTNYAAGGATWLQKTPRNIGGVHVAETFPEIITAIPLDPNEPNSPFHNSNTPISLPGIGSPTIQPQQQIRAAPMGRGNQPIIVKGELHITNILPNGKVLSKEIQPYLLEGFSGIT